MKHIIKLLILITLILSSCSVKVENNYKFKVTRIIDGDTFWVVDEKLNGSKIRLIGIDTPELNTGGQNKEFFADQAKEFLSELIANKEIRLEYDKKRNDQFGRTLAYAFVNDTLLVNRIMVERGYAQKLNIPPNTKYAADFVALEQMAKARKIGIWQKP